MAKRGERVFKKSSFGGCDFSKTSPTKLSDTTTTINFTVPFEEALKLSLAVDECVRHLNSYNRAIGRGKLAALAIVIHLNKGRIRISEGKVNDPPAGKQ